MDAATAADQAIGKAKARGRKDSEGQEAVIKTKPLKDSLRELGTLKAKSDAAKEKLNDAIKAVAEKSGLLSSVVRKFVNAATGEKFEEERRKVEQAALVFDEVQPVEAA